eukprot:6479017-Amphidinium_carterae.1
MHLRFLESADSFGNSLGRLAVEFVGAAAECLNFSRLALHTHLDATSTLLGLERANLMGNLRWHSGIEGLISLRVFVCQGVMNFLASPLNRIFLFSTVYGSVR